MERIEDGGLAVFVRGAEDVESVPDAVDLDTVGEAPDVLEVDGAELHAVSPFTIV